MVWSFGSEVSAGEIGLSLVLVGARPQSEKKGHPVSSSPERKLCVERAWRRALRGNRRALRGN
eukprot:scaffold124121_cov29-Tisochrysis_lutea.AAC.2